MMEQLSMFEDEQSSPDVANAAIPQEKIVYNYQWLNDYYGITWDIKEHIGKAIELAKKGRKKEIRQIKKYIERYPDIPHFKNYLAVAYDMQGDKEMAEEICRQTIEEHPKYVFGWLTYANSLIFKNKLKEAKELLNDTLNLQKLFPEREKFEVDEVMMFWSICCNLMLKQKKFDKADEYLALMKKTDPGHPEIIETEIYRFDQLMISAKERLDEEGRRRRSVEGRSYNKQIQTDKKPSFTHPEVEELYQQDLDIDYDIIEGLLELPDETLIEDLELVLTDAIRRYEYFANVVEEDGYYDTKKLTFPLHALFLLAYKKSEQSLPAVLNLYRQGQKLLRFWFGDMLETASIYVFGNIGTSKIDTLKGFLKEEQLSYASKIGVTHGMLHIGLKHPETKEPEIVEAYCNIFSYFVANKESDELIDTDLITQMVWNCLYLDADSLADVIKALYVSNLVEPNIVGDKETVLKEIKNPNYRESYWQPFFDDIYELYDYLYDNWIGKNLPEENIPSENTSGLLDTQSPHSSPEELIDYSDVGRNDPCPCGSGRKYKHCCLD